MKLNFLLDIIFPCFCLGCGEKISGEKPVCAPCLGKLRVHNSFFCGRCGARLPVAKKICHPDHPYILGAALDYHAPVVKALIKNLKFKGNKRTAEILADLLYGYIRGLPFDAGGFYILPVPLSEKRQRERGFNQAGLIAELLAAKLGSPLLSGALFKERHTEPQSKMKGRAERQKNLAGVFSARPEKISGKNILLVDDVTTSGATFLEAARALKSAGAKKIIALAAAKA